jgi:hypothetical protein
MKTKTVKIALEGYASYLGKNKILPSNPNFAIQDFLARVGIQKLRQVAQD